MPETKHKRAKNIKGKEFRFLAAEALRMPREPTINLARRLATEMKWPGPTPSVEVLKKKITDIRKKSADYSDIDKPWSVVTTAKHEYHIPPDALPLVMRLWKYFQQRESRFMTIREGLWVVMLSALLDNRVCYKEFAEYVVDYAALEKLNEVYGRDEGDERVTDSQMYRDMTGLFHDEKVENERDRHPKGEGVRWEEGEKIKPQAQENES